MDGLGRPFCEVIRCIASKKGEPRGSANLGNRTSPYRCIQQVPSPQRLYISQLIDRYWNDPKLIKDPKGLLRTYLYDDQLWEGAREEIVLLITNPYSVPQELLKFPSAARRLWLNFSLFKKYSCAIYYLRGTVAGWPDIDLLGGRNFEKWRT